MGIYGTWRCANSIFVKCSLQDKWDKEADEQRTMNPDPNIKIIIRCSLDPSTCGNILKEEPPKVELSKKIHHEFIKVETGETGQIEGKKKKTKKKEEKIVSNAEQARFF